MKKRKTKKQTSKQGNLSNASYLGSINMRTRTVLSMIPSLVKLISGLLFLLMTLDWKVRKARRAFERELMCQGVSKKDAQRISRPIKNVKDEMVRLLWRFRY
ncbi:MAG: hypothetical protein V3T10_01940 [Candidatus Bathyarchaeia archaeon]